MVIPSLLQYWTWCSYIKFNIGIVTSDFKIFQLYDHTLPSSYFLLLHQVQYGYSNRLEDLPSLMVIPSLLHVSYCYIKFNIGIVISDFKIFQPYGHTLPSTCFLLLHEVQGIGIVTSDFGRSSISIVIPSLLHVSYCYIKFNIGILASEFNIFQLYGHTLPSTCF